MTRPKVQIPDVRELVRISARMRSEYYLHPDNIDEIVQNVLEALFVSKEPTKDQIVDTASFVIKMLEVQKNEFKISDHIEKAMADAEAKTSD